MLILQIVPLILLDWSQTATGLSQVIPIARRIDLTPFEQAIMNVRVSLATTANANDSIAVACFTDGYSPDDPGRDFGQLGTSLGSATLTGFVANPTQFTSVPLTIFGSSMAEPGLARIQITGTHAAALPSTFTTLLSIDLALKGEAPGAGGAGAVRFPTYRGYGRIFSSGRIRRWRLCRRFPSPAASISHGASRPR